MTQAGYAGNPRYNVAAAAIGCVVAGVGIARMSSRAPIRSIRRHSWLPAAALVAGVVAFSAGDLSDQVGELGVRADRRTDLDVLVDEHASAARCAPARTNQTMKAMLAWRLDVRMEHLADPPRPPAAVFRAPPGYAGQPAEPTAPPGFEPLAQRGDWTLVAACELTPSAARTAP
jgi:hypothetical protein